MIFPRRALLIRPADPFALGHHDHPKRVARRKTLAHVVESLGGFREKSHVFFGLYGFDSQGVTIQVRGRKQPVYREITRPFF